MQLVIDANILVAAFLKAATTRSLILNERLELYSPEHLLIETRKVLKGRFSKKWDNFSEADFDFLFSFLTDQIEVIPKEEYVSSLTKALEIAPHEEDAPYLALAIHLGIAIWSNDAGVKRPEFCKSFFNNRFTERIKSSLMVREVFFLIQPTSFEKVRHLFCFHRR